MPNFGLVIDSTYNPMSFELYSAPFEKYAKVYNEMADAFDTLEMEANKWEKLAKSEKDLEAYKKYLDYSNELRRAANDLAENGLSTKTRGLVSQMRKKYASEIQPMEDAYNYIQEKIKAQEQIKAKNPRVVFDNDFSTDIGITDVLNNPYISYNYTDLDAVEEDALKAAAALSSRNINISNNPLLGTAYKMQILGYALPDIVSYIKTFSLEYPEIYELYNNLKTKYGSYGQQVDDSIILGMLLGYSANASPIQVSSIAATDNSGSSGTHLDDDLYITEYITVLNDAGDIKRIALDSFTGQSSIDEGYYPLDNDGNKVKNADGTPANAYDSRVKRRKLKQVQTSGNHYIITTDDGMPLKQKGKIVGYDSSTLYFDTKDWAVKDRTPEESTLGTGSISTESVSYKYKKDKNESSWKGNGIKILDFVNAEDKNIKGTAVTSISELQVFGLPKGITLDKYDVYKWENVKDNGKGEAIITVIPKESTKITENSGNQL